jgi:hypothetical protein
VLALREEGLSFAAIAGALGMRRSADAHAAFLRLLRQADDQERARLAGRELARLDNLEARIRSRDAGHPEKMARRLHALDDMREQVRSP